MKNIEINVPRGTIEVQKMRKQAQTKRNEKKGISLKVPPVMNFAVLKKPLKKGFSARDWIRTSTSLRTLRPEHSASTNFATRA